MLGGSGPTLARTGVVDIGVEWSGVRNDRREVAKDVNDSAGHLLPGFFLFRFLDYFDEFLAALGDFGHAFVAFDAALLQGEAIVVGEDAEEVLPLRFTTCRSLTVWR